MLFDHRASDFFKLLQHAEECKQDSISEKEWFLTVHCLDELNGRHADTAFLCGVALSCFLQRGAFRIAGKRKWAFSVYTGLVFRDITLRHTNLFPALEYMSSVTTLQSELGQAARVIYTPSAYQEGATIHSLNYENTGFLTALLSSLFLKTTVLNCVGDSFINVLSNDMICSSIILKTRFWEWNALSILRSADGIRYLLQLPYPHVHFALRESYAHRNILLPHMSWIARGWYRLHFGIMNLFHLQPST